MEYCPYGDLFEFIQTGGIRSDFQVAKIFFQIVSAVQYCHSRGIAHRDLKPMNILIDENEHVKVCDFGFCNFIDDNLNLQTICGSPCYICPECIQQKQYDGQKGDIWSLGVILYELLTGNIPWDSHNVAAMRKSIITSSFSIPDWMNLSQSSLIKQLLSVNPDERPGCEAILTNNWVKNGKIFIKQSPNQKNVSEIIYRFPRRSIDKINGIVSPFLYLGAVQTRFRKPQTTRSSRKRVASVGRNSYV